MTFMLNFRGYRDSMREVDKCVVNFVSLFEREVFEDGTPTSFACSITALGFRPPMSFHHSSRLILSEYALWRLNSGRGESNYIGY